MGKNRIRTGCWGWGVASVEGSPAGTSKVVAMQVHRSETGVEAAGALADAPREGVTAQPAERTVGSPPQLHSHPLEAERAPGQQERSQWDCPEKAIPLLGLLSWAPIQIWTGKAGREARAIRGRNLR